MIILNNESEIRINIYMVDQAGSRIIWTDNVGQKPENADEASIKKHYAIFRYPTYIDTVNSSRILLSIVEKNIDDIDEDVILAMRMITLLKETNLLDMGDKESLSIPVVISKMDGAVLKLILEDFRMQTDEM